MAAQFAFSQTSDQPPKLTRYVSLPECAASSDANSLSQIEALVHGSKLFLQQSEMKSAYSNQSPEIKGLMLADLSYYRSLLGRDHLPLGGVDFFKIINDLAKLKAQSLQGVLSVGPGSDVRGGSFKPNKRVFVTRNEQGVKCWTYTQPASAEQVFDYEGFEEIAAIHDDQNASCSAVIVGQNHALTARHCRENGLLLIPTKVSRSKEGSDVRKAIGCSLTNQYSANCEFEVVSFKNVNSFSAKSTNTVIFTFKSPIDGVTKTFELRKGVSFGTPDIRLIEFKREKIGQDRQPLLVSARIASYSDTVKKTDGVFPFVRAGYGHSGEVVNPALTIGSWQGKVAPVEPLRGVSLDSEEMYAYVALFHPADQKSRICQGDSGGALFFGNPNGQEQNGQEKQARLLVGVISGAKEHTTAKACQQSPVETSQVINGIIRHQICKAAGSAINGCETQ
jgi:hypothetical protein